MPKIIAITDTSVVIGNEDGSLREVRPSDCTFDPRIGDYVEVFANDAAVFVNKVDGPAATGTSASQQPSAAQTAAEGGININITNDTQVGVPVGSYVGAPSAGGGKVVNKVAYALLALLLGGLGAHKFYAGKFGMGILYLVFCWTYIPAIAGLVEGIIALTKPADAYGNIVV